jgi:hypothetical protein
MFRTRLLQHCAPEGIERLREMILMCLKRANKPLLLGELVNALDGMANFLSLDAVEEVCEGLEDEGRIKREGDRFSPR